MSARPLCDFHVHTTYSDGAHTPTEIATRAYEMGVTAIGFSTHSYTCFDESYCIAKERIQAYLDEIGELKKAYAGRMEIFAGVEQDYYSDHPTDMFDYVIGSVHYVKANGIYYPVDYRRDILLAAADEAFAGDIYALIEAYYRAVGDVAEKLHPDVIGHFDVITKFNEKTPFFDETHPRYLAARQAALDKLLTAGIPFEANTGAIARGYKAHAYPAPDILAYIRDRGGEILLSSDSHNKETLAYAFDKTNATLTSLGFDTQATVDAFLDRLRAR